MTRISWPLALVVFGLITAVTVLLGMGKPVTELMSLATLVLGALLYGEVQQVKTQTNGNLHRAMTIVERAAQPAALSPSVTPGAGVQDGQSTVDNGPGTVAR